MEQQGFTLLSSIMQRLGALVRLADWTDVAAKAKRLVQSGQVTILRNAPTHVMAHVVGDHGEYDVEISRHDAQSQVIEQWNCECPWAQYAWDRTRKWKKYEGRPCSHVLAAYWRARGTPLDTEGQDEGFQVPRGQRVVPIGEKPGEQGELPGMPKPEPFPIPDQRKFSPDEEEVLPGQQPPPFPPGQQPPPPSPPPSTTDIGIGPRPKSPLPPTTQPAVPQREQLQLFDITSQPGAQPLPATSPVSIPGARPPTPTNPVQLPGTFSHWIPVIGLKTSEFIIEAADELTDYLEQQRKMGQPLYVALNKPVLLEQSGGKIPMPNAVPYDVSHEGISLYRVVDLGYNPSTGQRENADVNALQGAPEQTGQYAEAAANRRAEVIDFDPNLRMAYIMVPLNYEGQDVRLHPHSLKGWVDYSDIRPAPGRAPVRRR